MLPETDLQLKAQKTLGSTDRWDNIILKNINDQTVTTSKNVMYNKLKAAVLVE